jgi:hypothetical protein
VVRAVGVPHASVTEKLEAVIGKVVCGTAKDRGVLRASCPVAAVTAIVLAATVVNKSEQPNHGDVRSCARGKPEPIALDASPMLGAVNGMIWQVELPGDELPEMVIAAVHTHGPRVNA